MIVNVTTVAPGMVVCGFGIVDMTIEGEDAPLVIVGLPPGFAGTTTTVVAPGGTVTVLGGITVVRPCGPAVIVRVTIDGLELGTIVTTLGLLLAGMVMT